MDPLRSNNISNLIEELDRAEEDHLKGCPEADFSLRLAALLVDGILTYLAISGLQSLCKALGVFLGHIHAATWSKYIPSFIISNIDAHSLRLSSLFELGLKFLFVYFYFIISTSISGGTPGKLLLGLRVLDAKTGKKLLPTKVLVRSIVAVAANVVTVGLLYTSTALRNDKRAYHDQLLGIAVKRVHGVK